MNHTGASDFVAVYALMYLALINNWTADPGLGWKTPFQKRHGITPDISALLAFHFYELIYYLDVEAPFPTSEKKAGYWLGIAHHMLLPIMFSQMIPVRSLPVVSFDGDTS
jgi:hypothetical protein